MNASLETLNQVISEMDTLTGGDKSHPMANWTGHWKSLLREVAADIRQSDTGNTGKCDKPSR